MKKTILINAGPRKDWNTAQLVEAAERGAKAAGSETELVHLYDLKGSGCRSCLACKSKSGKRCHCVWPDDYSPLIDKIYQADTLIIGTPIYFGEPVAQLKAFLERLIFCGFSYDDYSSYFHGHIQVGLIYTMNAPKEYYEEHYKTKWAGEAELFHILGGQIFTLASCDTLQVKDYSQYNMASFSEGDKQAHHSLQFPKDLAEAEKLGRQLNLL